MSSPIRRRSALTGKNVNISNRPKSLLTKSISNTSLTNTNLSRSPSTSPLRRSQTPSIRGSPLKKTFSTTPSPIKKRQSGNVFAFHEDDCTIRESVRKSHKHVMVSGNDIIYNKENISPKRKDENDKQLNKFQSSRIISVKNNDDDKRVPLQELKTVDYMGYIEDPSTHEVRPLNVPFANNMTFNSSHSSIGSSNQSSPPKILRF